jgi:multidrug transporter EmrE-like cation transporter
MKWFLVLAFIIANSSAALFVKMASASSRQLPVLHNLWPLVTNVYLLLGVGAYGIAFLFYAASLAHFPITVAFPLGAAGSFILTVAASVILFQEPFSWTNSIGIFLIILGIFLTTYK